MSEIRINSIKIKNYRSFGNEEQTIKFPDKDYNKPVAIVGYNNAGKSNLMNAILYGLQINFVSRDTFSINDFHNKNISNVPGILLNAISTTEKKYDGKDARMDGYHKLIIQIDGNEIEGSKIQSLNSLTKKIGYNKEEKDDENFQAFGASKYFGIFYVNFHNIKEEIQTGKTSWGNIRSFLGKHIKKIVDNDAEMQEYRVVYNEMLKSATNFVVGGSKLESFINQIKENYTENLRKTSYKVEFGLPDYEDIFLQMVFKVGINENDDSLVPLDQFGDGFISMFVMSVIQTISENNKDKCLFLFEEPESFLHENHQEYFYKTVLCGLAEKGHQVIYTTHSDKMIDIFDTKGLIRLENDDTTGTIVKYNNTEDFSPILDIPPDSDEDSVSQAGNEVYNQYIKNIEPNLNKILFSKKVILVEGPNDLMAYSFAIRQRIEKLEAENAKITDKKRYAETFLNFHNIVIIPHHGKATALLLIQLCKHIKVDYFVINDFDFEPSELTVSTLSGLATKEVLMGQEFYTNANSNKKGMMTVNFNLIQAASFEKIHFNVPKLEKVIGYQSDDKDAVKIWKHINELTSFSEDFFPKKLEDFLLNRVSETPATEEATNEIQIADIPF